MDTAITFYVNEKDKDLIKKAADEVRLKLSVFCRYMILKHINKMGEKGE